jgi:hypothetical protein
VEYERAQEVLTVAGRIDEVIHQVGEVVGIPQKGSLILWDAKEELL